MNLIKLIIPFDAHIKTKRIIGHLIYYVDLDIEGKPLVVANYVSYYSVLSRGKYWDEWQINEQNVIELNNSNDDPLHSIAKMLRISMEELEPSFKKATINYYGKASRLWDFCLTRFLKNEFNYTWLAGYKGPSNRDSILTYYAKLHNSDKLNIKEIDKKNLVEYMEMKPDVLGHICEYNPDLFEYWAEQKGYQLAYPGLTPDLREWLIVKYQQRFDEIHEIIKAKSKYWAKIILNVFHELVQWADEQKQLQLLTNEQIVQECRKKIDPYHQIAINISLNWIAFWRYQGLIKEKKLNRIYASLFEGKPHRWTFTKKLADLFVTENWKEIATYLDPSNIAWLPNEIGNLLKQGIVKLGKRGILLDGDDNELSAEELQVILDQYQDIL